MRVAIFVDAGYLYAQGSKALTGESQPRPRNYMELKASDAIANLKITANSKTSDTPLLRIYWYDGMPHQGPSMEQERLADMDDVKIRLGAISPSGQQKGVDSLIVTDLIDLARNNAISDAVLLSGDEDIRIGVQIAQSFGVRVHLIGIEPIRGSQSRALFQESDTTTEWSKADVDKFLALKPDFVSSLTASVPTTTTTIPDDVRASLDEIVDELVLRLDQEQAGRIANLSENDLIPQEFDRELLRNSRTKIERNLESLETYYIRTGFKEKVKLLFDAS